MKPFFSIIIPLFNKEAFIEATLQSVFNQSFKDFEIIIVNDGSTDASLQIVQKIISNKINVTLINQQNQGLSATRNNGIQIAKGTVIALLDADDIWHTNFLHQIHQLYINFPEASLYGCDYLEKYNDNNILEPKKNIDLNLKESSFIVSDFFKANWFQPILAPSCFAFKKQVFKTVTFNPKVTYAEDIDFYIKSNLIFKFAYCYQALATINFNVPNQMTNVGFKGKTIPDFDCFETAASTNPSLKKYLDFNRYFLIISAKLTRDKLNYSKLIKRLDVSNLFFKQKVLLYSPVFIIKCFRFIKLRLLKRNIRLTSY